jgi:predicted Zn-ribbon and HTH transcriptional regulator
MGRAGAPTVPPDRAETIREAIASALREEPLTARELSERLSIAEREVAPHMAHLERSVRAGGERLVLEPPRCLSCGFVFSERARPTKPGRCPECRATRVAPPRFSIASSGR